MLFMLLNSVAGAQTIIKSYPDKVASRFSDYDIVGKNKSGVIVHYFGPNDNELVTYDDKLRMDNRRILPFHPKDVNIESFVVLPEKILLFYTTPTETYQYFRMVEIDEKLNISNTSLTLDSMSVVNIGKGKAFYVRTSPDKSKLLTFSVIKTKNAYFVRFTILNSQAQVLKKNIFTITETPNVSLKSIKINNQGNVVGVFGNEDNYNNSDFNFDKFTTLTYNMETNTIGEQVMQSAEYSFKNIAAEVSTQRDIAYLATTYKNNKNKNDIGLQFQVIDFRTNTVLLNARLPFSESSFKKTPNNVYKTWQDKATLIKPKRIIPRSDGGFILITEGEYKLTKVERLQTNTYGYYNAAPYMSSARYIDQNHYYDIQAFSINKDGTLDWQATMPKSQVSENDEGYYSSFAMFEANNVLKFLYNEDFYNIGNFVEYNINPNGQAKRLSVLNSEKQGLVIVPLKARQLDGNTIIFPSEQKRTLQFVMFKYD